MFCKEECRELLLKHLSSSARHAEAVGAGADMKQVSEEAEVDMVLEQWTAKDIVLLSCRIDPCLIISDHTRAAKSERHGPAGHKLVAASTRPLHRPVGHLLVAASIRPLSHVMIDQCVYYSESVCSS